MPYVKLRGRQARRHLGLGDGAYDWFQKFSAGCMADPSKEAWNYPPRCVLKKVVCLARGGYYDDNTKQCLLPESSVGIVPGAEPATAGSDLVAKVLAEAERLRDKQQAAVAAAAATALATSTSSLARQGMTASGSGVGAGTLAAAGLAAAALAFGVAKYMRWL